MLMGLLFSFLFSISVIGWGLFFRHKLFPKTQITIKDYFLSGLIGFFPISILAQALHLFLPISAIFQILIHFLGLLLFIAMIKRTSLFKEISWPPIVFFFLSLFIFVGYALQNDLWDDVSIYHMSLVGALSEEKLFLGWPNVHHFSLYLTNSHFISALMTPALGWYERADWSAVCALSLFTSYLFCLYFDFKKQNERLANFVLLILVCGFSFWGKPLLLRMVGFSGNDSLASIFSLSFLSFVIFNLLNIERLKDQQFDKRIELFCLASVLFVLAVLAKPSQIYILPAFILLALVIFKKSDLCAHRKNFLKFAAFTLVLPFIYIIHYFLSTGCFLPLITQTCSSASWAVDLDALDQLKRAVSQFARDPSLMPNQELVFPEWLFKWVRRYFSQPLFAATVGLFLIGFVKTLLFKNDRIKTFLFCALSASLIIWFVLAPDTRFASALFVICMAYGLWVLLVGANQKIMGYINTALLIILSVTILDFLRISKQALVRTPIKTSLDRVFVDLPVHHQMRSTWGVDYLTPNNPDPNAPYPGCWWGPFPCSPSINPNLKLEKILSYSVFTIEKGP
jgi:hypothetical protein